MFARPIFDENKKNTAAVSVYGFPHAPTVLVFLTVSSLGYLFSIFSFPDWRVLFNCLSDGPHLRQPPMTQQLAKCAQYFPDWHTERMASVRGLPSHSAAWQSETDA